MSKTVPQTVKNQLKKLAKENGLEYIEFQIVSYTAKEFEDYFLQEDKEIVTEYEGTYYVLDNF